MKEIERKFIVNEEKWSEVKKPIPIKLKQGYISKSDKGVVRIRQKDRKAYLTLKTANYGVVRQEFEYEIPIIEFEELVNLFCERIIEKLRYEIFFKGKIWEVDEFVSPKQSFILAEVELQDENEFIELPDWIDKEVSKEPMYFNSNLI